MSEHESPQSVSQWAEETFGPAGSNFSVAVRANREMAELLSLLAVPQPDWLKVGQELADVMIVLWRLKARNNLPEEHPAVHLSGKHQRSAALLHLHLTRVISSLAWSDEDLYPGLATDLNCVLDRCWMFAKQQGIDLQLCIDAKMAVNRERKWELDGHGHGYHVKVQSDE